jgi:hypothetical protein
MIVRMIVTGLVALSLSSVLLHIGHFGKHTIICDGHIDTWKIVSLR